MNEHGPLPPHVRLHLWLPHRRRLQRFPPPLLPAPAMKLVIGIPCLDFVPAAAAYRLAGVFMTRLVDKTLRKEVEVIAVYPEHNTIIPDARTRITEQALALGASHLLFLDSDIVIEADTINRLVSHHKDIVGASYVKRYEPHEMLGNRDMSESARGGLLPMATMPLGCCLIKLAIFASIPRPWFNYSLGDAPGRVRDISEDSWFCRQARNAGFMIWQDSTISVGHVGVKVFR